MSQAQGSSVSLRAGWETSYGVTGSSDYKFSISPTIDIKETQNLNDRTTLRGTRNSDRSFVGYRSVDGRFPIPLNSKETEFWLKGLFNAPVIVDNGDGTYTKTYKVNDTGVPSMFVELAFEDIGQYHLFNGIKANELSIEFGGDGELQGNFTLLGQKMTQATSEAVTPTTVAGVQFEQFQASITGATNVKNISIAYSNNLDGEQYTIGDGGIRSDIPLGMASLTGSFTAFYEDDTLLAAARNNTDQSFSITLTNDINKLEFIMDEVILEPTGVTVDTPQGLQQTFNFQAFYKTGANGSLLTVKLTNDTDTAL